MRIGGQRQHRYPFDTVPTLALPTASVQDESSLLCAPGFSSEPREDSGFSRSAYRASQCSESRRVLEVRQVSLIGAASEMTIQRTV